MPNSPFKTRALRAVRRMAGSPDPAKPTMVHPFHTYGGPDVEPVTDKVTLPRPISAEEYNARSARLSDAQLAGVRALGSVKSPPPVAGTKFGAVNGITGWAGAS